MLLQRAPGLSEKAKGAGDIEGKRIGILADIGANGGGPREKPCRASGRSLIDRKRGPAVHRFELVSYAPRAGFRVLAVIGLVSCAVRLRAGFTKFEREQPGKCRFAHDRPLPGVDPLGESR